MKCWRVHWHHDLDDEPVVIYSEIGVDDHEVRKVKILPGVPKDTWGTGHHRWGVGEA
ncbi:DUF6881 domain-containing protein [Streptomyces smyrnaeus]|uniref:DUF6881 domain-containing protein n=1 Tax=Streptomyces smyrnaeus TaxID=1387713 RepID=UPI003556028C